MPKYRFEHVHMDICGPFPVSNGYSYLLTIVDRFCRWPEVIPMPDITAKTVVNSYLLGYVSRYGANLRITTDRGSQFQSSLFKELMHYLGTEHITTTAYHPQANAGVERFHRTLKASLTAHCVNPNWHDNLALVLLGIRCTEKEDLGTSPAEMLYGTTLRLPGDFFEESKGSLDENTFLKSLRRVTAKLKTASPRLPIHRRTYTPPELFTCSHVFIRHDAVKKPLRPHYDGPFKVLERFDIYFRMNVKGIDYN